MIKNPVSLAYRSMIDLKRFRAFRERNIRRLSDQISARGLAGDSVIPAEGIMATLGRTVHRKNLKVWIGLPAEAGMKATERER